MSTLSILEITLVAAVTEDGVIGTESGGIPWRLPRDAAHFRNTVTGKTILLGRKTYGEMHGWFRDERPIVLTSNPEFRPVESGTRVVSSFGKAVRLAADDGERELMVCGGASVYAQAIRHATRMILTHVDIQRGEAFSTAPRFPHFNPADWTIENEESHPPDAENAHAIRIVWFRRAFHGTPNAGSAGSW